MSITSRMPRAEYDEIDALNISRLKEMKRSPQHYRYALTHRKSTASLLLGNAAHVATLEPERYDLDFVVWDRRTDKGKQAPRNGKHWEEFKAGCNGRAILMPDENTLAKNIATAVRGNELAYKYLQAGDPEVTLEWCLDEALGARPARSRVDWITTLDGVEFLVGLKTARDCRHFAFGSQAAKLGYHLAWAYYEDAYTFCRGKRPRSVEIVVEVAPPHSVAVYKIPDDVIEQGREEYWQLVKQLMECEATGEWPGPQPQEEFITLPSWAYGSDDSDLTDLGLTATTTENEE